MRSIVFLACTLAASPARADDSAKQVQLTEVLAAIGRAPSTQVHRHEIDAAVALVDAASAWPNPTVRVETNRLTARLVAGVTVPLPLFGTVGAARRVATTSRDAVEAEATVTNREFARRAVAAWIALARSDGELNAAKTTDTQTNELETIATGRFSAGAGSEVDVTTARVAHARASLDVATARHAEEAASAELAAALGWDPKVLLVAAGELPGGQAVALADLRAKLGQHPTHRLAERRVAVADATVAQSRREYWPMLALEAQVAYDDPTSTGTDALVALSFELPLFAHVGDRVRSGRATAAAERARISVTDAQLDGDLVAAYRRWQSASERVAALTTTILPTQEKAQRLSHQAYREGALDLAAVLQTDRDLANVRAELVTAQADLATAWVTLQDVAGNDLNAR